MIKFKELIHKETGLTIKYEDWLKSYEQNGEIAFYDDKFVIYPNEEENEEFKYTPPCKFIMQTKDVLFLDDFEIVYDYELQRRNEKGCQYCNGNMPLFEDENLSLYIEWSTMKILNRTLSNYSRFKIKCCPSCGRKFQMKGDRHNDR